MLLRKKCIKFVHSSVFWMVIWLNGWNQKSGTYLAYVELAFFIEKLFWLGNTKRCTHCKQRIP